MDILYIVFIFLCGVGAQIDRGETTSHHIYGFISILYLLKIS